MNTLDRDQLIVVNGKATAYFEDFLANILEDNLAGKSIGISETLPTTFSALYVAPLTLSAASITSVLVNNTGGGTASIEANIVPEGEIVGSTNRVLSSSVTGSVRLAELEGLTLSPGDALYVVADIGTVNVRISLQELFE